MVAALTPLVIGVALPGVAVVRRASPSPAVGWLVVLLAGLRVVLPGASPAYRQVAAFDGWLLPLGGSPMFGYDSTAADRVVFALHGGLALATLALGYRLWSVPEPAAH